MLGDTERYAVLLQQTPVQDVKRYWCDPPPPAGPGGSCANALVCAGGCGFGACAAACRDQASLVDGHWYDRLTACAEPLCGPEEANLESCGARRWPP